jgi:hypothetical protein
MAQHIVTVDDFDGSSDASTITFAVGRDSYEIDLSKENQEKLNDALAPFIAKARKVGKSAPVKRTRNENADDTRAIREWATANGHSVSPRGRIPQSVVDAYNSR